MVIMDYSYIDNGQWRMDYVLSKKDDVPFICFIIDHHYESLYILHYENI